MLRHPGDRRGLAASREIYRRGIGCELDKIEERWAEAIASPILPREVEDAPCHDLVFTGEALNVEGNALDGIPVPISTPGWDNAPYTTLSQYITRDPDTGVQNMGNYRGQVKAPLRLGMNPSLELRPVSTATGRNTGNGASACRPPSSSARRPASPSPPP